MPPSSLRDQNLRELVAVGSRSVHAGLVGHQPGGVGDRAHLDHGFGAVDELDQHARVHVAAFRFRAVIVRHGVVVERVVLALAGRDDGVAERGGELDQLHAARRLVAGADRIDDAEPVGLPLQVGADGDVGLDIHHHQMLAVLHRHQVEIGGDARLARRVDDHVDQRVGDQQFIRGDGDLPALDRRGDLGGAVRLARHGLVAIGYADRLAGGMRTAGRDRAYFDAAHQHALRHQIGAHFTGADDADPHRPAFVGASGEIPGKSGQGDIGHQAFQKQGRSSPPDRDAAAGFVNQPGQPARGFCSCEQRLRRIPLSNGVYTRAVFE